MTLFDDMIADMFINKITYPIMTERFLRGRKLNISPVFIIQLYFTVPENIILNSTHCFVMKIPKWTSSKSHLIIYQVLIFKTL